MPNPNGRPTEYKAEYCELAFRYCLLGCTDEKLAEFLDIAVSTLNLWKEKHPEFMEALKSGKEKADALVANSLYHRALGYSHPDEEIKVIDGLVVRVPVTKHYPPDTGAAMAWLKNRQKANWRDKQEVEHSTADGQPMLFRFMKDGE